jgi:hypothetical protein
MDDRELFETCAGKRDNPQTERLAVASAIGVVIWACQLE